MEKEIVNAKDWAKTYVGENVMYEGIATYKDESVFLSNETLNKVFGNLKGRPVIIEHKLGINPENMEKYAIGYVTKASPAMAGNGFTCEFVVWDDEAQKLLDEGYTLSTSYIAKRFDKGGTHINTPYDKEITDLDFTHLAIVKNPRYEKVKVYQNSIDEDIENDENLEDEIQNSVIIGEKEKEMDTIEVDQGTLASLLNCVKNAFNNSKEEKAKVEDDEFEYEGEKYSKKELVNAFKKMKDNEKEEEKEADDAGDKINDEEEDDKEIDNKCKEKTNDIDFFELMQERHNSMDYDKDYDKVDVAPSRIKAIEKGNKIYG